MSRLTPREMNDPHRQDVLNQQEWRLRIGETGLQYLRCDVKRLRWQFGEMPGFSILWDPQLIQIES